MNEHTTQAVPRITPPLGDIPTRLWSRWMACLALGDPRHPVPLEAFLAQRGATLDDLRRELIRRETLGVGVQ